LREGARDLRAARAKGASEEALQAEKQRGLEDVYTVLSIHLGTPPEAVQWPWMDRDKKFQRDDPMTPREFAEKYVTVPIDDYVCLVHDPRPDNPSNRTYTVEYLGNVVGGDQVKYLHVDIELMQRIARETIEDGEPVWFGCDVGKMMHR